MSSDKKSAVAFVCGGEPTESDLRELRLFRTYLELKSVAKRGKVKGTDGQLYAFVYGVDRVDK